MTKLKLSDYEVKLKEKSELKYGEIEKVQKATMQGMTVDKNGEVSEMKGDGLLDAKRAAAEATIAEITDDDGEEVEFSQDWLSNLPADDGMKLMDAVDEATADIGAKKK